MSSEKLIRMANQIASFFKTQPGIDQAQGVANHLKDFWEPRMLAALAEHLKQGGEGVDPLVVEAAQRL